MRLFQAGKLDEAADELARESGIALKHPVGMNVQASIWFQRGRAADALRLLDRAARVAEGVPETHFQRGIILGTLARYEEAAAAFDRAVRLRPQYSEALINRSVPLTHLGRFDEALDSLDEAARFDPNHPNLRFNRGTLRLLMGDFAGGWADYEGRLLRPVSAVYRPKATGALWKGEPLAGKTILVYDEQGFGDTFQFMRFLRHPAFADAKLTVRIDPRLRRLCQPFFEGVELVEQVPADAAFDYVSALLSLPNALGITLDTIPARVPYLEPEPAKVEYWRSRLGPGFKVAINWQGDPNAATDAGRSVPLRHYAVLAGIAGLRFISVQKRDGLEQLRSLSDGFDVEVVEPFDTGTDAFVDTAAILANVDLLITSDTAVAHLAGAMARPVWVALKKAADWRWLLDREDSPWYPTMRLYRQDTSGDWAGVFARIRADLAARMASGPLFHASA